MKINYPLYFSASVGSFSEKSLKDYLSQINWLRASGRYIVVDPNNSDLLLYLREKEYNKLVINSIANDTQIIVIATPDDSKDSLKARFPDSTTPKIEFLISRLTRLVSIIPGWEIKDSMIYFKRNFEYFIPYYYSDIITWLGIPNSNENKRAVKLLSIKLTRYFNYRGVNNLIIVLKISMIVVLKYLANEPLANTQELGQRIRLINGLPAYFPVQIRLWIRQGSIQHIRVIMTLLYSYKAIKGKWGLPDVSSIQAPAFFLLEQREQELRETRDIFFKHFTDRPVDLTSRDVSPPLILTAGSNGSPAVGQALFDAFYHCFDPDQKLKRFLTISNKQFGQSLNPFSFAKNVMESYVAEMQKGTFLWGYIKRFPLIKFLKRQNPNLFKNLRDGQVWSSEAEEYTWQSSLPGRLSLKLEAAGKVRVFAMIDYFSQYALRPLHEDLMKLLKNNPSDATYNQMLSVEKTVLERYRTCYSFDLKSATDLIPSQLYKIVLGSRYGDDFTHAWFDLLVNRPYIAMMKTKTLAKHSFVKYTRGQPMGALSSWPALAVIHHYLVWLAAYRVNKDLASTFSEYLVLGDDLVIFSSDVAQSYLQVCKDYGVTVGLPKSYISDRGLYQFASQNVLNGQFITPLPLGDALASSKDSSMANQFKLINSRLEFSKRINRLGYMKDDSILSFVKAQCSYYQWKRYCKFYFPQGRIPGEVRNMILLMLNLDLKSKPNIQTLDRLLAALAGEYSLLCSNKVPCYSNVERSLFVNRLYKLVLEDLSIKSSRLQKELRNVHQIPFFPYLQSLHLMFCRALGGSRFNSACKLANLDKSIMEVRHKVYKYLNDPAIIAKEMDVGPLDNDIIIERHLELINLLLDYKQEMDSLFIRHKLTTKFVDSFVDGKVNYYIGLQLQVFSDLEKLKATMAM
jgi:hypothetical protein